MQNAINILVIDDGANRKGCAVGKDIFRQSPGQFHLNVLLGPPQPEESILQHMSGVIGFLDYPRVGRWRRAESGEPGLPAWTKGMGHLYLIGTLVVVTPSDFQKCVSEILIDIPRFQSGQPVLPVKPQSAVHQVQQVHDLRQSPR
jgi:hypothetical protein